MARSSTSGSIWGELSGKGALAHAARVGNRFAALARAAGHDPAQLGVVWVREQPGITAPIVGPRTLAQLEQQLGTLEMRLSDSLRARCDELVAPGSVVASFFNTATWMKWKLV